MVIGEQVARSATWAMLRSRRNRASLICSPTVCIFCSSFRGSLLPIVVLVIQEDKLILRVQNYAFFSILCYITEKNIVAATHF
jgi:hypothetical protein